MSLREATAARRAQDAAPLFAALGDATRLQLLMRLSASGPESIAQMSEKSAVTRQAITKHLQVLADAGFVAGERRGREHIWHLRPRRLRDVHAQLDRIGRQWDDVLGRLCAFVQEDDAHG
jgi:DNA-binding transcriptional ArsR family regulator